MSAEDQLKALLEIIQTSTLQAIAEYKKDGNEVPTIYSKTSHPIDSSTDTVVLKKAVRSLVGACQQLCASLVPPQHIARDFAIPMEWACMHVVVRAKVADALEKYPNGLHVDQLSKEVNLEKGKLARVLRYLATKGCFIEVGPNVFSNNRVSLVTLSNSDNGSSIRMWAEDISEGAVVLYDTMVDPEYATSYHPDKSPLIYALKKKGIEGGYFDFLNQDAEKRENFHRAMVAISKGSLSILNYYPWNEVKTVCDVGAGIGAISRPLAVMHPHLKITHQDLPDVIIQAKDVWAKNAPEVLQSNRVEFIPLNFLEGTPAQGLDVYYLRNIIHDWPDAETTTILGNVRKAMAPHSRLLLHGTVLNPVERDVDAKSSGLNVAPEGLSPNFGHRAYQQDMLMWLIHNAQERTLDHVIALGSAVDLKFEKAYDLSDSVILEFRVATA